MAGSYSLSLGPGLHQFGSGNCHGGNPRKNGITWVQRSCFPAVTFPAASRTISIPLSLPDHLVGAREHAGSDLEAN
jgi:hypothetical protein